MENTNPNPAPTAPPQKEPGSVKKFLNSVIPGTKRLSRPSSRNASPSPSMKDRSASSQQQGSALSPSSPSAPDSSSPTTRATPGASNLPSQETAGPGALDTAPASSAAASSSKAAASSSGAAAAGPSPLISPISPTALHHTASQSSLPSPISSQIFERNVQEPLPLPVTTTTNASSDNPTTSTVSLLSDVDNQPVPTLPPQIPTHVLTEDHIPAALDASSIAITAKGLDTDDVAVVTSKGHQPAAEAVEASLDIVSPTSTLHRTRSTEGLSSGEVSTGTSPTRAHEKSADPATGIASAVTSGTTSPLPTTTATSPVSTVSGSGKTVDPRRLSFISFADVMHAEHVEHDNQMSASQTNLAETNPTAGGLSPPMPQEGPSAPMGKRSKSPAASLRKGSGVAIGSPLVQATSVDDVPSPVSDRGSQVGASTLSPVLEAADGRKGSVGGRGSPLAGNSRSASRNRSRATSGTGVGLGLSGEGPGGEAGEVKVQSLTDAVREVAS